MGTKREPPRKPRDLERATLFQRLSRLGEERLRFVNREKQPLYEESRGRGRGAWLIRKDWTWHWLSYEVAASIPWPPDGRAALERYEMESGCLALFLSHEPEIECGFYIEEVKHRIPEPPFCSWTYYVEPIQGAYSLMAGTLHRSELYAPYLHHHWQLGIDGEGETE